MSAAGPPLSYQSSPDASEAHVSTQLPAEVITCLKNARYLHLATCEGQFPHVSLMNYTYLPMTRFSSTPIIIMTTNPSSKKTHNLVANPHVSLLVHDWVSHRPPTRAPDPCRDGSPPPQATRSSLASLLLNINTSAMSRISATINGEARILEPNSEEEKWCKSMHLENNTFGDEEVDSSPLYSHAPVRPPPGDGGRGHFIEGEEVRVVVVQIRDGRISDFRGEVKDFIITNLAPQANGAR